ncbi:MAG: Clp protease N-terminal domain-containing protein, partial [Bacteroidota bacterium]
MNFNKFTIKAQESVQAALELAQNRNHQAVEPAHLLMAMLADQENIVHQVLGKLGVRPDALREKLEGQLKNFPVVKGVSGSGQHLSNESQALFDQARKEATELGDEYVSTEHLLLAS